MQCSVKYHNIPVILSLILFLLFALLIIPLSASAKVVNNYSTSDMLLNYRSAEPGQKIIAMLHIHPKTGWHVYWKNPGDSGLAPEHQWNLPPGISAGEQQYLPPTRMQVGDLVNFGYKGDAYYFIPITIDKQIKMGDYQLNVTSDWLICEDICVPEQATFTLPLTIAKQKAPSSASALIAQQYGKLAKLLPSAEYFTTADSLTLIIPKTALPQAIKSVYFYPEQESLLAINGKAKITTVDSHYHITLKRDFAEPLALTRGILQVEYTDAQPKHYYQIQAKRTMMPMQFLTTKVLQALLFAFLGGLILNVMPCVFPILALKALSISQNRDQRYWQNVSNALFYMLGILLTFTVIASILLTLRLFGHAVGWGYQLQSPIIIALLAYLFFFLALCFTGYVHIGTSLMGLGQGLTTSKHHSIASFFTGILAVFVASPCTVPFMATAIGFAFTQPAAVAITIILALGFGFAIPLLLIAIFPPLTKCLPKPGAWTKVFQEFLAFLLFASVVWLLWVLIQQAEHTSVLLVMLGLLGLAFAIWLSDKLQKRASWLRYSSIVIIVIIAFYPIVLLNQQSSKVMSKGIAEPFSEAKLNEALSKQQLVLVNQTAAWCLTCKYNEKVALSTEPFYQAVKKYQVRYLVGDWTNRNPEILSYLREFNRDGVPLYVIYDYNGKTTVLPQLLTTKRVVAAIEQAAATKHKESNDEDNH